MEESSDQGPTGPPKNNQNYSGFGTYLAAINSEIQLMLLQERPSLELNYWNQSEMLLAPAKKVFNIGPPLFRILLIR